MKYSLTRIFQNIVRNKIIYLIIMANFILGVGLFTICMNFETTSKTLLKECKQQGAEGVIAIRQWIATDDNAYNDEYSVSYSTYTKLCLDKRYSDNVDILFSMDYVNHTFVYDPITYEPEEMYQVSVHFMNEKSFVYQYGFKRNDKTVYLGADAYQGLLRLGELIQKGYAENMAFVESKMYIEGQYLIVDDKKYLYQVLTEEKVNDIPSCMIKNDSNVTVIFPIEDVFLPVSAYLEEPVSVMTTVYLKYTNDNWIVDPVSGILYELNSAQDKMIFETDNTYLELKRKMDDFSYDIDRWKFVSISIILLSGVGCIGAMYLLLHKRRHFIAISIACGSTWKRIIIENIMELFIVLGVGGVIGILISPVFENLIEYKGELHTNRMGIFCVIIFVILFSLLSVMLAVYEMKANDIAGMLKDE